MAEAQEQLKKYQDTLRGKSAEEVLAWAAKEFSGAVCFASSLGAEDQVLTAMIGEQKLPIRIFTLDTGRLFPESYTLLAETEARYGTKIQPYFPDAARVEAMVKEHGINLFYESVQNRKLCCGVRKVEPLKRALAGQKAWITGLRREQSDARDEVSEIDWDSANNLFKFNPLAAWTNEQVWDYIKSRKVPYSELHDKGFVSIGCAPCTRAIQPGESFRAGRWWWEHEDKKECGIHIQDGELVRVGSK